MCCHNVWLGRMEWRKFLVLVPGHRNLEPRILLKLNQYKFILKKLYFHIKITIFAVSLLKKTCKINVAYFITKLLKRSKILPHNQNNPIDCVRYHQTTPDLSLFTSPLRLPDKKVLPDLWEFFFSDK